MTPTQKKSAYRLYIITTLLSVIALIALGIAQAWVRWKFNQNFEFIDDFGFASLAILVLGELLGLAYLIRSRE